MPHGHQVVREPGDKEVPVVVEAKETEADTDKVAIGQQPPQLLSPVARWRRRPRTLVEPAFGSPQPRENPQKPGEPDESKGKTPIRAEPAARG